MRVLVTGATGLVGNDLVWRLTERGDHVRALVRDPERARPMLPEGTELHRGDLTDTASLTAAVKGMQYVFHAGAVPELIVRDPSIYDRVNHLGTAALLRASEDAGVARFIYTSSMSVFSAPQGGRLHEDSPRGTKQSGYERSKQDAERAVDAAIARGLDAVVLNPGGIYGPSPAPNLLNGQFLRLARGKVSRWTLSGGLSVLFVRGCTDAHLAAAERGRTGARYLLADSHHSMQEILQVALAQAGHDVEARVVPHWLMTGLTFAIERLAGPLGFKPPITREGLSYTRWDVRVDAGRAQRELGFVPTPLAEGIAETLRSFKGERPARPAAAPRAAAS